MLIKIMTKDQIAQSVFIKSTPAVFKLIIFSNFIGVLFLFHKSNIVLVLCFPSYLFIG